MVLHFFSTIQKSNKYRRVWHPCHTHEFKYQKTSVGRARMPYPPTMNFQPVLPKSET